MFLVGHRRDSASGSHPMIMTSYGGYGVSMTPQFSVFVAFLIERGCLFALAEHPRRIGIRRRVAQGCQSGAIVKWHSMTFFAAAEWLIETGRTEPAKLAIFGGSNSGLLVGAAMTQRPDLFRAVVCMVPMLDMLRYHLFDNAHVWKDEFGTAEDPDDFAALLSYSPYHSVRDGTAYPATMIVSGRCRPELQSSSCPKNDRPSAGAERHPSNPIIPRLQPIPRAFPGAAFERADRSSHRPDGVSL